MTIVTLPSSFKAARLQWGQKRFDMRFENGDTGAGQSRILGPQRWTAAIVCPGTLDAEFAADWRALILSLEGRTNQVALHDLGQVAPRGTMRGTLTLASAAAAGSRTLSITGGAGQAGKTLLKTDWLGLGQASLYRDLVPVASDATADGSGLITVTLSVPLKWGYNAGDSVVWDKPTALFRQVGDLSGWVYEPGVRTGYSLDLIESWEA